MEYKEYNANNLHFFAIKTDKFKNCYIEVRFRDDLKNVALSTRFLLIQLMAYTSKKYPTKREKVIALEEMYNLGFSIDASLVGENHISSFCVDFLHPKYVKEQIYLNQILEFLFDTIKYPNIKNNHFDQKTIDILKEQIHVNIDQYKENPLSFAKIDSRSRLFKNSFSSKRIFGTHEELAKVNNKMLLEEYNKLLNESICEILIIGDLDILEIVKKISQIFKIANDNYKNIPCTIMNPINKLKEEIVKSSYNQTQLLCYYQIDNMTYKEKNFIEPLFSRIFGSANMTDKLTKYLRIENSLCYYSGFISNPNDNYGFVYVGLNKKNIDKAKKMINKALKEMIAKDIDEKYFENQKTKFLADLKIREDDIYGLIDTYYFHKIFNRALNEEYALEIPKITLNDIADFAKKLKLSYIYILEEGDNNANN